MMELTGVVMCGLVLCRVKVLSSAAVVLHIYQLPCSYKTSKPVAYMC